MERARGSWVWPGWLGVACLLVACGGGGGPDAGPDADGQIEDGAEDGQLEDGGEDGGGQDPGPPDGADGGCQGALGLGEPCADDCDCAGPLRCRGLPGDLRCLVPCQAWDGCPGTGAGCAEPTCDLDLGACRCACLEGGCDARTCFAGWCVGCAEDAHCAGLDCSADPRAPLPRCRLDAQACVCGGTCGDLACDPAEEALGGCPGDCPGPCREGAARVHACKTGELVPWCTCRGGAWDCLAEPAAACPGETACELQGGQCVDSVESCFDGQVAAEAHGCSAQPLCCLPRACTGPGQSYYPYLGVCCPGLRALPSRAPVSGMLGPELPGVSCFDTCWALLCAPCGDGACQPWLAENVCTCPEDCPLPPYDFVCQAEADCGVPHCRAAGEDCLDLTPACQDRRCAWTRVERPGWLCDPLTRRCVPGP